MYVVVYTMLAYNNYVYFKNHFRNTLSKTPMVLFAPATSLGGARRVVLAAKYNTLRVFKLMTIAK